MGDPQRYNPVDVEKVEGNLRMTEVRRMVPITQHYYSNYPGQNPKSVGREEGAQSPSLSAV